MNSEAKPPVKAARKPRKTSKKAAEAPVFAEPTAAPVAPMAEAPPSPAPVIAPPPAEKSAPKQAPSGESPEPSVQMPDFETMSVNASRLVEEGGRALAAYLKPLVEGRTNADLADSVGDAVKTFGKVADPIADKALTGVALIGLSLLGDLPWWVTVVILVREVGVTLLRFWVIEHGVIPASRGGKAKTAAQTLAITMYLVDAPWSWWATASAWVMGVAVVLTLVTGVDYVVRAVRLRRQPVPTRTNLGVHRDPS